MKSWHIVTGEFPPAHGGVSDYSYAVASALAAAGDAVHVWCPDAGEGDSATDQPIDVHRLAGSWSPADLHRIGREMDQIGGERTLLLQWVPHAFGQRSLNVGFCRWIRRRAKGGDALDIMVHEPGLAFREGSVRHDMAAAVHRLMLTTILREARRVWVAIPAWADVLRPWALGRDDLTFAWLPVPSTLPVAPVGDFVRQVRASNLRHPSEVLVGHFSTYQPAIRRALRQVIPSLLEHLPEARITLLGRGSDEFLGDLRGSLNSNAPRVDAAGDLDASTLSAHLQACDLLVQPYPDGASSRRTTLMAALAHGVPVATTTGRLSEPIWQVTHAVRCAPAGDAAALVSMAAELARDAELRREMSSAARALYQDRFNLSHVVDALRAETCGAAG
jgi:glycosyltransferase involved in cell wall biosynthesis